MKLRFLFSILLIVCIDMNVFAENDTVDTKAHVCSCPIEYFDTLLAVPDMNVNPSLDSLAYTTALINALNNAISIQNNNIDLIAVVVAIIGILLTIMGIILAVVGYFGFKDFKKEVQSDIDRIDGDFKEHKSSVDNSINRLKQDIDEDAKEYKKGINEDISGIEKELQDKIDGINKLKDNVDEVIKEHKQTIDGDIKEYKKGINEDVGGVKKEFQDKINEINKLKDNIDETIKEYKQVVDSNIKEYKKGINEDISELKKELQGKIEEINEIKDSVDKKTEEIKTLAKKQEYQNQFTQRINEYLFSITHSVVDSYGGDDKRASVIRAGLYNQYYIVKVFLPWSDSPIDSTEAAFRYLQANGTEENIKDLQFIVNNDPDDRKRNMALETIGYIRARSMNGQAS